MRNEHTFVDNLYKFFRENDEIETLRVVQEGRERREREGVGV